MLWLKHKKKGLWLTFFVETRSRCGQRFSPDVLWLTFPSITSMQGWPLNWNGVWCFGPGQQIKLEIKWFDKELHKNCKCSKHDMKNLATCFGYFSTECCRFAIFQTKQIEILSWGGKRVLKHFEGSMVTILLCSDENWLRLVSSFAPNISIFLPQLWHWRCRKQFQHETFCENCFKQSILFPQNFQGESQHFLPYLG